MAFVVEDGTGSNPLANSYTSVEFADAYFTDRNNPAWTGTDQDKEAALIQATDYVDKTFCFIGQKTAFTNPLQWPRSGTPYAEDEIPIPLQKAVVEYALRALTAPLAPDPVTDPTGRAVTGKRSKVGPIEKETQYAEGSAVKTIQSYPAADAYLKGLIVTSNRVIR